MRQAQLLTQLAQVLIADLAHADLGEFALVRRADAVGVNAGDQLQERVTDRLLPFQIESAVGELRRQRLEDPRRRWTGIVDGEYVVVIEADAFDAVALLACRPRARFYLATVGAHLSLPLYSSFQATAVVSAAAFGIRFHPPITLLAPAPIKNQSNPISSIFQTCFYFYY